MRIAGGRKRIGRLMLRLWRLLRVMGRVLWGGYRISVRRVRIGGIQMGYEKMHSVVWKRYRSMIVVVGG